MLVRMALAGGNQTHRAARRGDPDGALGASGVLIRMPDGSDMRRFAIERDRSLGGMEVGALRIALELAAELLEKGVGRTFEATCDSRYAVVGYHHRMAAWAAGNFEHPSLTNAADWRAVHASRSLLGETFSLSWTDPRLATGLDADVRTLVDETVQRRSLPQTIASNGSPGPGRGGVRGQAQRIVAAAMDGRTDAEGLPTSHRAFPGGIAPLGGPSPARAEWTKSSHHAHAVR